MKKERITILTLADLKDQLTKEAKSKGLTLSAYLNVIIDNRQK